MDNEHTHFILGNRTYDFFKKLVQLILPAFGALYFGLASIWGLPEPDKVVGTSAVIATFLGVILGISSKNYDSVDGAYDGYMVVTTSSGGGKTVTLELNEEPVNIEEKNSLSFKVKPVLAPVPDPESPVEIQQEETPKKVPKSRSKASKRSK